MDNAKRVTQVRACAYVAKCLCVRVWLSVYVCVRVWLSVCACVCGSVFVRAYAMFVYASNVSVWE